MKVKQTTYKVISFPSFDSRWAHLKDAVARFQYTGIPDMLYLLRF